MENRSRDIKTREEAYKKTCSPHLNASA